MISGNIISRYTEYRLYVYSKSNYRKSNSQNKVKCKESHAKSRKTFLAKLIPNIQPDIHQNIVVCNKLISTTIS